MFDRLVNEPPESKDQLQKTLLQQIQARTGRKTIAYFANFYCLPYSMLTGEDKIHFVLIFKDIPADTPIDFILNSPGGYAEATEMVVQLMRPRYRDVRFIIPHSAKSAATMLALSGNEILMFHHSELGPTDPQIKGAIEGPALSILEGFEEIKERVEQEGKLNGAYVPLLMKMDIALLKLCENSINYGKEIVTTWLKRYMLKDDDDPENKAKKIIEFFNDKRHLTHAKPIFREDAIKQGVKIKNIEDIDQEFADMILEYYTRFEFIFSDNRSISKIYHSETQYMVKRAQVPIPLLLGPVPPSPPQKPPTKPPGP